MGRDNGVNNIKRNGFKQCCETTKGITWGGGDLPKANLTKKKKVK
jgi:hypothetical protein